jgi:hypothetical protein
MQMLLDEEPAEDCAVVAALCRLGCMQAGPVLQRLNVFLCGSFVACWRNEPHAVVVAVLTVVQLC